MIGRIAKFVYPILAFVFVAMIGFSSWKLFSSGWRAYESLNDSAQTAWAVGVLSLAGTIFSLYYTKLKEKQLQIEAVHTAKKQKLYNQFINEVFEIIMDAEGTDAQWLPVRKKFISNALLWSDEGY